MTAQKTTVVPSDHLSCRKWNNAYDNAVAIFGANHFHAKSFAYHRCFCMNCHKKRNDKVEYNRAGQKYELPVGYCAIALQKYKPPKTAFVKSFHGTSKRAIRSILREGFKTPAERGSTPPSN